MKLIVGLGNPWKRYESNRHNIGFMALDAWVQAESFSSKFSYINKFAAEILEANKNGEKLILVKPMLFMNKSGWPLQQVVNFYKLNPDDVLVLHDEIDHDFWSVKLKLGWGHAGHNGLRDIIEKIGKEFSRVRIGVGHPGDKDEVSNYVLSDFSKKEKDALDDVFVQVFGCVDEWLV